MATVNFAYLNNIDVNIKLPLSKWYGNELADNVINTLKSFYIDQNFDDDGFNEDWDEFEDCDGIDKVVEELGYSELTDNEQNKRILFNWFRHWLFPDIATQPTEHPPHPKIENIINNSINKPSTAPVIDTQETILQL